MKIKTSELTGHALDWAAATAEGFGPGYMKNIDLRYDAGRMVVCMLVPINREYVIWSPTTRWAQGGPIIEREMIDIERLHSANQWYATHPKNKGGLIRHHGYGPTPLIAAMRCYVASKLGDEVEIPEELI